MKRKEKRIRELTWRDYEISKDRYNELKAFCRQYYEKKDKINYGLGSAVNDGMPKGNTPGNPTERAALENAMYKRDCAMIEEAAIKANPVIYRYIIKSVAKDLPFELIEYDEVLGKIPYGKTDFYGYRRLFYFYLHLLKIGDKSTSYPCYDSSMI